MTASNDGRVTQTRQQRDVAFEAGGIEQLPRALFAQQLVRGLRRADRFGGVPQVIEDGDACRIVQVACRRHLLAQPLGFSAKAFVWIDHDGTQCNYHGTAAASRTGSHGSLQRRRKRARRRVGANHAPPTAACRTALRRARAGTAPRQRPRRRPSRAGHGRRRRPRAAGTSVRRFAPTQPLVGQPRPRRHIRADCRGAKPRQGR